MTLTPLKRYLVGTHSTSEIATSTSKKTTSKETTFEEATFEEVTFEETWAVATSEEATSDQPWCRSLSCDSRHAHVFGFHFSSQHCCCTLHPMRWGTRAKQLSIRGRTFS